MMQRSRHLENENILAVEWRHDFRDFDTALLGETGNVENSDWEALDILFETH